MVDSIFPAASWTSLRNEESRRIDKLGFSQDSGAYARLQTGLGHQIHFAADQAFQFFAQRSKLDQADTGVRLKIDQDVYITVGTQIPTCSRAEDSEFSNAIALSLIHI